MTPAEHYAEAERLLSKLGDPATAASLEQFDNATAARGLAIIAATAQVHATLACATIGEVTR